MISNLVVRIEKLLLKRVELLTVSSPQFKVQYYKGIYSGKVVLLENVPSRATWTGFRRKERVDGVFCIGFIGIIRYIKSLEQLLEAVSQIVGEGGRMKVLIAGGTADGELLQRFRRYANFVHFSGPYEYNRDIKQLYSAVDLVYAVYDDGDRNCQLAMPNKFYEAIIARIPIIVAKDTYVASEVLRLGIGETVRTGDVDGLCDLLRGVDARHGWYDRALAGLKDLVPEQFFDSYERAAIETVCKQSL
jgi:glycosyltransferase involved in cell wall biosynthesis